MRGACYTRHWRLCVRVHIGINKSANHALVLRMVFGCLGFEEINTFLTESNSNFHSLLSEREIRGRRQEVSNDFGLEWFIGVFDFRTHKSPCLSASNRRRRYESRLRRSEEHTSE